MSVWSSIHGNDVRAIENTTETNYTGQGTPDVLIDVAVTALHNSVRVSLFPVDPRDVNGVEVEILLDPENLDVLVDKLLRAKALGKSRRHRRGDDT